MDEVYAAKLEEARPLTGQERVLVALQRLENTIDAMTETVFGPQEVNCLPEALRETIGVEAAIEQFTDRLEAGLGVACKNLSYIQMALSRFPNKGYRWLAK